MSNQRTVQVPASLTIQESEIILQMMAQMLNADEEKITMFLSAIFQSTRSIFLHYVNDDEIINIDNYLHCQDELFSLFQQVELMRCKERRAYQQGRAQLVAKVVRTH